MSDCILVTGATGFIGSHLVPALRARGHQVLTHSQRDGDIAGCRLPPGGVRHVFHLAARAFVPGSWNDPLSYYRVNVLGTVNVLEYCRNNGASLTFLSSYVYGVPQSLPVSETHPVRPSNPYSHTKILAEQACAYFHETFHVPVAVMRLFNVYGPGQAECFLVPTIIKQALSPDSHVLSVADVRPRRDYTFIDDAIDLLIRIMDRALVGTYNAGSGVSVSVADIANLVNGLLQKPKPLVSRDDFRPGEVLDVVADIRKARMDAGWTPTVPLREGLARTFTAMNISAAAECPSS